MTLIMILSTVIIAVFLIFVSPTLRSSLKGFVKGFFATPQKNELKIDMLGITWSASMEKLVSVRTSMPLSSLLRSGLPNMRKMLYVRLGELILVLPIRNNWELLTANQSNIPLLRMLHRTLIAIAIFRDFFVTLDCDHVRFSQNVLPLALYCRLQRKYKRYSITGLLRFLCTDPEMQNISRLLCQNSFVIDYTPKCRDLLDFLMMSFQQSMVSHLSSRDVLSMISKNLSEKDMKTQFPGLPYIAPTSTS